MPVPYILKYLSVVIVLLGILKIKAPDQRDFYAENTHKHLCSLQDECNDLSCEILCLLNEGQSNSSSNTSANLIESLKSRTRVFNTGSNDQYDFCLKSFRYSIDHFVPYLLKAYSFTPEISEKPPQA